MLSVYIMNDWFVYNKQGIKKFCCSGAVAYDTVSFYVTLTDQYSFIS